MEAVGKTTAFFMDIQQKNTSLKKKRLHLAAVSLPENLIFKCRLLRHKPPQWLLSLLRSWLDGDEWRLRFHAQ